MIKTINEKTYYKEGDNWYGHNKNGDKYKVIQPVLLAKLNIDGLGDVVSTVTKFLGVRECEDCKKRRETLNSIFPFTKTKSIREITEDEIHYIKNIKEGQSSKPLFDLYNSLFYTNLEVCACTGLQRVMLDRINLAIDIQLDEKNIIE